MKFLAFYKIFFSESKILSELITKGNSLISETKMIALLGGGQQNIKISNEK